MATLETASGILLMSAVVGLVAKSGLMCNDGRRSMLAELEEYATLNCMLAVSVVTGCEGAVPPIFATSLEVRSVREWLAARMLSETMLLEGIAICSLMDGGSKAPLLSVEGAEAEKPRTIVTLGELTTSVWSCLPLEQLRARVLYQFGRNQQYRETLEELQRAPRS
jgi:hypothetical protein